MEGFEIPWLSEYPALVTMTKVLGLLVVCYLANLITSRVLVQIARKLSARTQTQWDDALVRAKVFSRLGNLAPALVAYFGAKAIPDLPLPLLTLIERVAMASLLLILARAVTAVLSAVNEIYMSRPENLRRPIKGYIQVVNITLYVAVGIVAVATLMDKSPLLLFSGIGAMTAVLLLIFKDTILSLVASVQLTGNDMIRVGDWIEMSEYGADGNVIDIALHTVKVQNWDKTITTVPTHKLIEDSFKNWRGMETSGGRRIKRSLFIDTNSIRFLDETEVEHFGEFALLKDYIHEKRDAIDRYNRQPGLNPSFDADIRRLTNIGTLRAYIVAYLRNHPKIHRNMTLIVRQRDPTPAGLPMEIYAFSNDIAWANYEGIQSDIFDHILAIVPEFGLRVFQSPSGSDFSRLVSPVSPSR